MTAATSIRAVRSSHELFTRIVSPLSSTEVEQQSYNTEWSIADTASHLGSQAEIFGLSLDAGLGAGPAPDGDAFSVIWDRWNALAPTEQVRQSISANETFVSRVEQTTDEQRVHFSLTMFGRPLDLSGLLLMRLGEHALHTWDIAVALDDAATVASDSVALLIDELPMAATRAGRPTADAEPVHVVTTDPSRTFVVDVGDEVTLQPSVEAGPDPLVLPAEALIRLVYGRLDPEHTPADVDDSRLATLRTAFPGF